MSEHITPGTIWYHNGRDKFYTILLISNEIDDEKYPKTVVYFDDNKTIFSNLASTWEPRMQLAINKDGKIQSDFSITKVPIGMSDFNKPLNSYYVNRFEGRYWVEFLTGTPLQEDFYISTNGCVDEKGFTDLFILQRK